MFQNLILPGIPNATLTGRLVISCTYSLILFYAALHTGTAYSHWCGIEYTNPLRESFFLWVLLPIKLFFALAATFIIEQVLETRKQNLSVFMLHRLVALSIILSSFFWLSFFWYSFKEPYLGSLCLDNNIFLPLS